MVYNVVMKSGVREPKQARSIEKKKKIIEASFELFSEVGYYGTNTAEIAKRAGVSTGIVYEYFHDKRDIMICVLDEYIQRSFNPVLELIDEITVLDLNDLIIKVIDRTIESHKGCRRIHEALHSLTHTDEGVNNEFIAQENILTHKIGQKLIAFGMKSDGIYEKVHLAMNLVQSFAHEYVFDQHDYIDYGYMKTVVCKSIRALFTD